MASHDAEKQKEFPRRRFRASCIDILMPRERRDYCSMSEPVELVLKAMVKRPHTVGYYKPDIHSLAFVSSGKLGMFQRDHDRKNFDIRNYLDGFAPLLDGAWMMTSFGKQARWVHLFGALRGARNAVFLILGRNKPDVVSYLFFRSIGIQPTKGLRIDNLTFWLPPDRTEENTDSMSDSNAEGPIVQPRPISEIRQTPHSLSENFEWVTLDMVGDEACLCVCNFLKQNYSDGMFQFEYSMEFLRWALCPPGYNGNWHLGVRSNEPSQSLQAFISGIPVRMRVRDQVMMMAEINFFCIPVDLRSDIRTPVLRSEMNRRVGLENIWQVTYSTSATLQNSAPLTTCRYWHRPLNLQKLIYAKFPGAHISLGTNLVLPNATTTLGFRRMVADDAPEVNVLLRNYLSKYTIAPDFNVEDVIHKFLPRKNVVDSYVVESVDRKITDFCSFYTLPLTLAGNTNTPTLRAAYSYYNIATETPLPQLMKDVLIVAKQQAHDVFNALDVMENECFFKTLKFVPCSGQRHYHLYNYKVRTDMNPSGLGLVLL